MASGTFYPAVSGDDGFAKLPSGSFYSSLDYLIMGNNYGDIYSLWVRFPSVTIPQGATITSAFVRQVAFQNNSGTTCNLYCYFNNEDNAVAPVDTAAFEALSLTDGIEWNNVGGWTDGSQYDTSSLVAILQNIIDRGGWSSGNAIQLIVKNNASSTYDSKRRPSAIDFNSGAEKAELHVTWTETTEASIAESLSSDDSPIDTSQGVLAESLSSDDSPIDTSQGVLAESLSIDNLNPVVTTYNSIATSESLSSDDSNAVDTSLILEESLSLDDGLAVTTETTMVESLSADDSISLKWNAQCLNEESLSVESLIDIIHSNVYGRYKNSLNYNGNTLQLKIQNNTAGEPFFLQDLGMLLYANEVQRQSTYSMNLKSQNIRLKIQNNTAGETLHLLDVGTKIYSNEAR